MFVHLVSIAFGDGGVPVTTRLVLGSAEVALALGLLVGAAAAVVLFGGGRRTLRGGASGLDGGLEDHRSPRRDLEGYRRFLAVRDGEPNLIRHTLSRREALFEELERTPVRSRLRIDRELFLRNLWRRRPEPGLDDRLLWLLATAKANQAERFAVGLAEILGRIDPDEAEPIRLHVQLQETYHTRILADVVAMFGLPVRMRAPALPTRLMIRFLVTVPDAWGLPVAGFAEMVGCVTFRALRDRGVELFADEPEVAARIRRLYDEILADEIGHVGYIAAVLGPRGRAVMRLLYARGGARLAAGVPELGALLGRDELERRFAAELDLDALAAEIPGKAYVAAPISLPLRPLRGAAF
jgi:hypothetical protein